MSGEPIDGIGEPDLYTLEFPADGFEGVTQWDGSGKLTIEQTPEQRDRFLEWMESYLEEHRDELPFRCQWEIGIQEAGEPDEWDHYHPRAKSKDEATRLAQQEARDDGFTDPCVINVFGPMKPENAFRVVRK